MYAKISPDSIRYRKLVKSLGTERSMFPLWRNLFIALCLFILTPVWLFSIPAFWSWYGVLLSALLFALGFVMIGTSQHTASHGGFGKKTAVNNRVRRAMYLTGIWLPNWLWEHNYYHHSHTNMYGMDKDLDSAEKVKLVFSPRSKVIPTPRQARWLYVMSLYALTFISWIFIADVTRLKRYHGFGKFPDKTLNRCLWELISFKVVYLSLILIVPIVLGTPWYIVIPFWFLGWALAGMIMMPVFQIAHINEYTMHYDEERSPRDDGFDFYQHTLNTTVDFYWKNPTINRIMTNVFGWLNYQTPHHHFRGINPIIYEDISAVLASSEWSHGVKYHRITFGEAIKSHFTYLKNLTSEDFRKIQRELHEM